MKLSLLLMFSFLTFSPSVMSISIETKYKWDLAKEVDGIKIFEADVKGADVVAFRGETTLNFPLERVVSSLADMKRKQEWMHDLKEVRTLEIISPRIRVEYYHSGTPWPLSDRDFVYLAEFKYFPKGDTFVLNLKNAEHKTMPRKKGIVRGKIIESNYYISKTDKPGKTKIAVEILVDPMGSVPKWLVNIFQKDWPRNTLTSLKKLMSDPSFKTNKRVAKYINDNILLLEKGE
jgi:hypothetical protein